LGLDKDEVVKRSLMHFFPDGNFVTVTLTKFSSSLTNMVICSLHPLLYFSHDTLSA
jgi:hypothetical protein